MKQTCPNCKKIYTVDLRSEPDFTERYANWRSGALIQKAWPNATPTQREQLQTGICSDKCWDEYLGVCE